ncbi:uncharacterized protein Dwil_GK12590 [Drosophila willistoni]|uniref:Protein javelin n=1 Tax=Drosophila willistoni TaxID=7260 RepID=B4N2Z0_DROWI|nr:uncharacterized protein Dwil_GK12590 [Drosophila willistoni]
MGNGYFRTSQTTSTASSPRQQQRDKRDKAIYSYQHNYVDRVRLEDTTVHHQHDLGCPQKQLRATNAGWRHSHKSPHWTQCHVGGGQLRNARSLDYTQLEEQQQQCEENSALDIAEFYWRFDAEAGSHDQVAAVNDDYDPALAEPTETVEEAIVQTTSKATATATLLDILGSGESCSLRRSRSLAVIREETFSDLQIGSVNSNINNNKSNSSRRRRSQLIPRARLVNRGFFRESPRLNNKHQQTTTSTTEEQPVEQTTLPQHLQHPWHNDKSDLESLNSDYFKNSLHQNLSQHQHLGDQQLPSSLEEVSTLLKEVRPRLYQSRRQQQQQQRNHHQSYHCIRHIDTGGLESCPEHSQSQSSLFPETTTTSNSADEQTDESPSLSEQEYDLTHIEEIFKQEGNSHQDLELDIEKSYELISLTTTTTTTRTRFDTSEEEQQEQQQQEGREEGDSLATPTGDEESQLRVSVADNESHLDKIIAYDSVYLSSEDSSECTLIGESCCESFTSCLETTGDLESRSLLHISIDDSVYEPTKAKQYKKESEEEQEQTLLSSTTTTVEASQIFTQVLKVESNLGVSSGAASKPNILSVVEKRKFKPANSFPAQDLELKRQVTDLHLTTKSNSNLQENQYHSLPDVNIGVSLKVCESIDKELRSSYNQQKLQQRKQQETKRSQSHHHQQVVTRAETYDSIRRFGRAHQKARQKERKREQEREREREQEKESEKPAETKPPPIEITEIPKTNNNQQVKPNEVEIEDEPLPPPPPPLTKEEAEEQEEEQEEVESSIGQPELPKEAPVIEVANFSKLIERRAQEIRGVQPQFQCEFVSKFKDIQNNIQTEANQHKPSEPTKHIINPKCGQRSPLRRSVSSSGSGSGGAGSFSGKQQKPTERRILSTGRTAIYKARPVKLVDSFRMMSRPQILHVVDGRGGGEATLRRRSMASNVSHANGEMASEYLQKVDAVRCYWNKLAGSDEGPAKKTEKESPSTGLSFQLGGETTTQLINPTKPSVNSTDYCSMLMPPSIEIVELGEGSQKATIVSAAGGVQNQNDDTEEEKFDHIRYKVLKSQQLIRSNILSSRNKKEAQFDGLIQYLQDYSFQELLSNNNVVIVEPVRTKIERPLTVTSNGHGQTTANVPPKPPKEIHASGTKPIRKSRSGNSAAAKRHFFYQPVRVNRELYEDELPDPDTVRNVRQFFEQNIIPTPGRGLLIQSQQKFGGSAYQLSPRETRKAGGVVRGYRYLTIDTSFGEAVEQPKGMDLLLQEERDQHKGMPKHWDNASLSSGISSGDLSSPCGEYLQHHHHPHHQHQEDTPVQACKGVHVQDVIRRHNSNAANANAKVRRTWCMGGGAGGASDSLYRQIYENKLSHAEHKDDDDEADGKNVTEDLDEQDEEEDMCENYYVSNDVLAKIRECGSTVTYYGGRVLEKGTQPQYQQQQHQSQRSSHLSQIQNGTRSRIRQIEACNVCLPIERCQHQLQTKHEGGVDEDIYQGIKFKLVKSNSCSSRLELAGTDDALTGYLETEVVRKMVHHFEGGTQPTTFNDLTINSHSTTNQETVLPTAANRRQVTVNNHINVFKEEKATTETLVTKAMQLPEAFSQHDKENTPKADEILSSSSVTYQSQAMNIHLDKQQQPSSNGKVCRNKNVDLAYTLVKQQQPTGLSAQSVQGAQASRHFTSHDNQESQKIGKQYISCSAKEPKYDTTKVTRPQIIVPVEIHHQQQQQQVIPISTPTPAPAPIPERRLSNASSSAASTSTASIVDKAVVVRHYVANDKTIYERRKYDDIEFEEFEVYDPSKDQQLEDEQEQQQVQGQEKPTVDNEPYDSLDDRM